MNDPYESYKLYNALKLHFESDSYDAVKYNYKTSLKPTSFFKRNELKRMNLAKNLVITDDDFE